MKKVLLILVVAVIAAAVANPVEENKGVAWSQRRTVRAADPYHVQYRAGYGPPRRYGGYYESLSFGIPLSTSSASSASSASSTYARPRAYYQQPGISYRWVGRPGYGWNEQVGFNVYGPPIVYSGYRA